MKIKKITWIDSASLSVGGWHHKDDIEQLVPMVMKTAGYVVKETKRSITIASSVSEDGSACGEICIPKFAIVKKRKKK